MARPAAANLKGTAERRTILPLPRFINNASFVLKGRSNPENYRLDKKTFICPSDG